MQYGHHFSSLLQVSQCEINSRLARRSLCLISRLDKDACACFVLHTHGSCTWQHILHKYSCCVYKPASLLCCGGTRVDEEMKRTC